MVKEAYCSFEVSKLLEEKGFNENCGSVYRKTLRNNQIIDEPSLYISNLSMSNSEFKEKSYKDIVYCSAPTHQMAMAWLREEHKLIIITLPLVTDDDGEAGCLWGFKILNRLNLLNESKNLYYKEEEAVEAALRYTLEHLLK